MFYDQNKIKIYMKIGVLFIISNYYEVLLSQAMR